MGPLLQVSKVRKKEFFLRVLDAHASAADAVTAGVKLPD